MADNPKLFYFNIRGRAEIVRLTLAAGNIKFEDNRFSPEEWPSYKAKSPFGTAPYMEIDGQLYGQSLALAMYAARKAGLYGNSIIDQLKVDQVTLMTQDIITAFGMFYKEKNQDVKMRLSTKFKEQDAPRFYGHFERLLKESGTGYFVGESLSLADIAVFEIVNSGQANEVMKTYVPPIEDYPAMQALIAKLEANEGIKAYLATRVNTPQ